MQINIYENVIKNNYGKFSKENIKEFIDSASSRTNAAGLNIIQKQQEIDKLSEDIKTNGATIDKIASLNQAQKDLFEARKMSNVNDAVLAIQYDYLKNIFKLIIFFLLFS